MPQKSPLLRNPRHSQPRFLPTTVAEMRSLGWDVLDIILVTGDTYIDSPFIGAAVIGRVLVANGFRVGIIAQPDTGSDDDITRLGEPRLFWGISGGSVDSLVANYTPLKKRRKSDDFTPGGQNNRRPDRAVIAYANLIRRYFKDTRPLVLGGIEASLRRFSHYDFWSDSIRRSILFDAKADILVYGMAERTITALAAALRDQQDFTRIPGICYPAREPKDDFLRLPDVDEVKASHQALTEMFHLFYHNNDPISATGLYQKQDSRYLIQNPPSPHLTADELDRIYEIPYSRDVHPFYQQHGKVPAEETIRFSITSHRGCYGECNFCAIGVHQGRTVLSRSADSIIREVAFLARHPMFKGNILDIGGPTANMYGFECPKKIRKGSCREKRCLTPAICPQMPISHHAQTLLLTKIRRLPEVKNVFVASGIRYDMILADHRHGGNYLQEIVANHVSGQLKIAPEHTEETILQLMGKPGKELLQAFKDQFYALTAKVGKNQFLTYYFIAAHPGCTQQHMENLKKFCHQELRTTPEQLQIFTPTPSTYSSLMYCTEKDPWTGKQLFVEKDGIRKEKQKEVVVKRRQPAGRGAEPRRPIKNLHGPSHKKDRR